MKTTKRLRQDAKYFREEIAEQAMRMKVKLPKHFYCPGPKLMVTVGTYVKACKAVLSASPDQEFKHSFQAWYPMTAAEIRRYEILPAIHERINARGLMQTKS